MLLNIVKLLKIFLQCLQKQTNISTQKKGNEVYNKFHFLEPYPHIIDKDLTGEMIPVSPLM
jgi:hypothetical protein